MPATKKKTQRKKATGVSNARLASAFLLAILLTLTARHTLEGAVTSHCTSTELQVNSILFRKAFGATLFWKKGQAHFDAQLDLNRDDVVNTIDYNVANLQLLDPSPAALPVKTLLASVIVDRAFRTALKTYDPVLDFNGDNISNSADMAIGRRSLRCEDAAAPKPPA